MRHALLIALAALPAAAAPAAAESPVPAVKARAAGCHSALDTLERRARFTGDMRALPGAARLQIRFVLQARTADEPRWSRVEAPGFGTWNTAEPGVGRYVYTKTVENLLAPAAYRARVHFRWRSASGRTLLRVRRTTRVCRQLDLRPDLVVETAVPTAGGYDVTVANAGRTAAGRFTVTAESGGRVETLGSVERLAAGERIRVAGRVPPCAPGDAVLIRVDPEGAVDEADEQANTLSFPCGS